MSTTTDHLIGPPEIHHNPSPATADGGGEDTPMETLVFETQNLDINESPQNFPRPPMGLTENLSPTFLSTGNPCLDFFFHVVPDTPPHDLIGRLQLAWTHNPLTALKLVCNLRGVRGTGKSDKEGFYAAASWMHKTHPKTLACNVPALADFGYFKDLLEILYRLLEGFDVRENQKKERPVREKRVFGRKISRAGKKGKFKRGTKKAKGSEAEEEEKKKEKVKMSLEEWKEFGEREKEKARILRKEKEAHKAKNALDRYNLDPDFRFLHDQISGLFADLLRSDVENLNSGKLNKISLASKWCPTIDSSYDKSTLICESIARKLFPRESDPGYDSLEERHYVFRIRDRMRKEVLVPLHRALELPEVYMSANRWDSLPYSRVPSVAMKNYKELFKKHDSDRFKEYLERVKSGEAKIAAGALLPHEIIGALKDADGDEIAELQWKRMVEDMQKKGKLSNCIAVCDVSGSMAGIPMEVCVALGVLVSELSEEPWKGKVITFSADPQLHRVEGETLLAKTEFVRRMEWGTNTNFQRVFDRLLEVAVQENLSDEQMIKRVFVFSDMEFDEASARPWGGARQYMRLTDNTSSTPGLEDEAYTGKWETDYEVIKRKFRQNGFENVPEIVFWNLRDSKSTPVVARQSGVALVSGFSKNLLTMFLEGGGIVNPEDVMELAISGEEYKKLAVFD